MTDLESVHRQLAADQERPLAHPGDAEAALEQAQQAEDDAALAEVASTAVTPVTKAPSGISTRKTWVGKVVSMEELVKAAAADPGA